MLIDLYADTKRKSLGCRGFIVTEISGGWEWCHAERRDVFGFSKTLFEALEAAHDAAEQMLSDKLDRQFNAADEIHEMHKSTFGAPS